MKIWQIPILSKFIAKQRRRLSALQEATYEKGEKELKDILGNDEELQDRFPIPGIFIGILIWVFIIFFPLMMVLDPGQAPNQHANIESLVNFYIPLFAMMFVFIVNQRILVKHLFFKKRYGLYLVSNFILVGITGSIREIIYFHISSETSKGLGYFLTEFAFTSGREHILWSTITFVIFVFMTSLCCILINVFTRQVVRGFILREKRRVALQNELDFLKQQLSPHFLFNTLNNISALIQFDPKKAEESMTKLSSLLRVMLYQTTDKSIALTEDIEILKKYADLEKLRLDPSYDLAFNVSIEDNNLQVPPLLIMPLVENAIKHSINPKGGSFAHIDIKEQNHILEITVENSNFPRKSGPKAGGLGLATLTKRLELIYSGHYTYATETNENTYKSKLVINL